jgi:flagellar protein FliS
MLNPYNYSKPKQPVGVGVKKQTTIRSSVSRSAYGKTDNYLEQKVMSAKPEELTLMLYEGIIKFVKQAKLFNERNDIEQSNRVNMRAQAIIQELRSTLDMSIEISESFESLYIYMNDRLVEANAKKDNEILDEVIGLAEDFRDTWKEAMNL